MTTTGPIATLLIDAPCELCRTSMRWVRDRDRDYRIHFESLDSPEGRELLFEAGLELAKADSIVLIHGGRALRYSAALVSMLRLLGGWWKVAGDLLWLVPRPLRDIGYRVVARHRHLWPFNARHEQSGERMPASDTIRLASADQRSMGTATPASTSRPASSEDSRASSPAPSDASRALNPAIESTATTRRDASE